MTLGIAGYGRIRPRSRSRAIPCVLAVLLLLGCHQRRPEGEPAAAATPASLAADRHEALGERYFDQRRYAEAEREWKYALDLDPSRVRLRERLGAGQAGSGSGRQGDERVNQLLEQAKTNYRASRLREARSSWLRALELEPVCAEARQGLENLEAEAFRPNPDRPFETMTASLYQEGMQAWRAGDWVLAQSKLAEAAKLDPGHPQIKHYEALARQTLDQLRENEAAVRLRDQALRAEQDGEWPLAHRSWREVLEKRSADPEAAEGVSRTARALDGLCREPLRAAQAHLAAGQYAQAEEEFQQVLQIWPGHEAALQGRQKAGAGKLNQQQGSVAQARAEQHWRAGEAFERQGKPEQALREWEAAAAADPKDPRWPNRLAEARTRLGRTQEQKKQRAQARYAEGLAAYQRGEVDAALAAWQETLDLDPDHAKARANIRRIEQEMQ